jgi:dipeptidyl aminopeptidase/acylaminoacyl peptidase
MAFMIRRGPSALLVLGLLVTGGGAAAAGPPGRWTAEAVVDTVAVANVVVSPDGSAVVFTRTRWRSAEAKPGPAYTNLWRVPFGGGEPQELTTADGEDQRPRYSPDGTRLAFLSKRGSGESPKARLFVLPLSGGEAEALTDEKTDVTAFEWSPDGRSLAYLAVDAKPAAKETEEKAGRDMVVADQDLRPRRLWILDPTSRQAEKLASLGERSAWEFDWAPDSSALVATVTEHNRTDDAYLQKHIVVLPRQGAARELVGPVGKVAELAWSRDGRTIAWLGGVDASDPATGSVFVVPAAGGTPRNLTGSREETGQALAWRGDGRLAVLSVSGTRTTLSLLDPASGSWQPVLGPEGPALTSLSASRDGVHCAFVGSTAAHPPDVYVATVPGPAAATRARTSAPPVARRLVTSNPAVESLPRGRQETIRYTAKDGLAVEGVVVRPIGFRPGVRYPLIVVVHGGPEAQYLDGWNTSYGNPAHLLAERGYAVFFPNYRGSTGRGVAFAKGDHRDLGGKEFTDVLDGVDFLAGQGWVDPARVGITGGSYGGYFTALGVTRYSDRFRAGVEFYGISNWESFLGQSDIPVENALVHWALWCYEQAALCRDRSPVAHIDKARTPTLILQGQEDARVPKPQADELYAALRWKKVPVEYVAYPREPHGFRERAHRLDALTRLVGWFEHYLPPES